MTIIYRIGKIKKDNKMKKSRKKFSLLLLVIHQKEKTNKIKKKSIKSSYFLMRPCLRPFLQFHFVRTYFYWCLFSLSFHRHIR